MWLCKHGTIQSRTESPTQEAGCTWVISRSEEVLKKERGASIEGEGRWIGGQGQGTRDARARATRASGRAGVDKRHMEAQEEIRKRRNELSA